MKDNVEMEDALMSVKVLKNEEGNYVTKFIVHGGTVNEFTFGPDEDEAKSKTAMLIDGVIQGLEFVQNTVREKYSEADDDATE